MSDFQNTKLAVGMYVTRPKEIMRIKQVNADGTIEGDVLREMARRYMFFKDDTWNPTERPHWVTYGYTSANVAIWVEEATPHQISMFKAFEDQRKLKALLGTV
jgi:hypothetical protein